VAEPVPYLPLNRRPRISWPGGARVALWVAPNVEFYELVPPENPLFTAWGRVPEPPDVLSYGHRDYGNRVGFWRVLEVLDRHGVRATASLNVAVLERHPEIGDAMAERGWAFMGHGLYNSRFLYGISREDERALYREMQEIVVRRTGRRMRGMFGPHASLSPHTMDLMAEEGFLYSADWLLDDQPFPIATSGGRLVGVPYSFEVNDGPLYLGSYADEEFVRRCRDQFDVLYEEGADSGRVMCIVCHPFLLGQPHRIGFLDDALAYVLGHDGVWQATGDEIAEWYVEHHYDEALKLLADLGRP
jgi:peptidoglycan/xylan/chitin deacetylase (PgdA/CDA1 family)